MGIPYTQIIKLCLPRAEDKRRLADIAQQLGMTMSEYLWHRARLAELLHHERTSKSDSSAGEGPEGQKQG